jgi:hypothetical protein
MGLSRASRSEGLALGSTANLAAPIGRKPVKWRAFLHLGAYAAPYRVRFKGGKDQVVAG